MVEETGNETDASDLTPLQEWRQKFMQALESRFPELANLADTNPFKMPRLKTALITQRKKVSPEIDEIVYRRRLDGWLKGESLPDSAEHARLTNIVYPSNSEDPLRSALREGLSTAYLAALAAAESLHNVPHATHAARVRARGPRPGLSTAGPQGNSPPLNIGNAGHVTVPLAELVRKMQTTTDFGEYLKCSRLTYWYRKGVDDKPLTQEKAVAMIALDSQPAIWSVWEAGRFLPDLVFMQALREKYFADDIKSADRFEALVVAERIKRMGEALQKGNRHSYSGYLSDMQSWTAKSKLMHFMRESSTQPKIMNMVASPGTYMQWLRHVLDMRDEDCARESGIPRSSIREQEKDQKRSSRVRDNYLDYLEDKVRARDQQETAAEEAAGKPRSEKLSDYFTPENRARILALKFPSQARAI